MGLSIVPPDTLRTPTSTDTTQPSVEAGTAERGPALRLARDACAMTNNANPLFLVTLALAQHLTGDTPAASETEKKALSLLPHGAAGRSDYEAALARFEATLQAPAEPQEVSRGQ